MSQPQEFEKVLSASSTAVAAFDGHDKTALQRFQHFLHSNPAAIPLIVLLLSLLLFGLVIGQVLSPPSRMTLILQQVAIVGIIGAAQTLVILTAGIDLSVGAIMVLSSVVMGQFTFRYGLPPSLAILCGFGRRAMRLGQRRAGRAMKLPPFIVTLGTWQIILAANFLYSANETIRSQDIEARRRSCSSSATDIRSAARCSPTASIGWCCWSAGSGMCSTTPPGAAISMPSATTRTRRNFPACASSACCSGLCRWPA
jgi:fructose transport system permease protein